MRTANVIRAVRQDEEIEKTEVRILVKEFIQGIVLGFLAGFLVAYLVLS